VYEHFNKDGTVAPEDLVKSRVARLMAGFSQYIQSYDDNPPFTADQMRAHRQTIQLRQQAAGMRAAVESDAFVRSLYTTLQKWGLDQRASKLVPVDAFGRALRAASPRLEQLELLTINGAGLPPGLTEQLWQLVSSLDVVENAAKIVAGTKTLHHLLPDLVPPIDRKYTRPFFGLHDPQFQDSRQPIIFRQMYGYFAEIARQVHPEQYVTGAGWRTSCTKLLDNAVVAFWRIETGKVAAPVDPADSGEASNKISFDVPGFPPPKDGGNSAFNAAHRHLPRVRVLLEAAHKACTTQDFAPVKSGCVGMDIVLYTPPEQNPADAANYIGGVADVLEHKGWRDIDHLGSLADVWLYWDDKQIKEINFREVDAEQISYRVTVRELGS
jgi:hypothetical protein